MFNGIATDGLEKFIHKKNMSGINEISEFLLHEVIREFLGQHKISLRELAVQSESAASICSS